MWQNLNITHVLNDLLQRVAKWCKNKYGINNFLNPTLRDAAIVEPQRGAFCIIKQDELGNDVNEIQVYTGSEWTTFIPSPIGNTEKYLKSNGIIATWESAPDVLTQIFLTMGA